jgi:hypothetical protein
MDHHYIPQFYLKRWARPDGQLSVMRLVHGRKVAPSDKYPAGTGYLPDLYRTDGVPDEKAQHLEVGFMSPLDNAANRALERILALDESEWDGGDQKAWVVFLLSLMFRNPETVAELKDIISEMWGVGLAELEVDYESRRLPDFPETFAEFIRLIDPAAPQIAATNFIMQTIENERIGPGLVGLHWSVIRTRPSIHPFVTSDRPIVRPLPFADPAAYLALPVDPHTLFLASKRWGLEKELSTYPPSELVDHINYAVISQARQFVWGVDETQIENVRKYIAEVPSKPLLSAEQREKVLASARGGEAPESSG